MTELVSSVCLGVADLVTDGIAYSQLVRGEIAVPNEGYRLYTAAYSVILCFGVVTTMLSLAYRLRNARLMRAHVRELGEHRHAVSASTSAARRQVQQNEWELVTTHRTKIISSLTLLSVVAQGALPLRAALHARLVRLCGRISARLLLQVCRCPV